MKRPYADQMMQILRRSEERRTRMAANRAGSHEEAERWDLEYWQSRTPAERLAAWASIQADIAMVQRRGAGQ